VVPPNHDSSAQEPTHSAWSVDLQRLAAIRFSRRSYHFTETVQCYRDLVGLPLYEQFEGSYETTGAVFALPVPSLTLELVASDTPVAVDAHEQLCLYFPDSEAMESARRRLVEAGIEPMASHPYWAATGAVTYRDPDGGEIVFAPFVYGVSEPAASAAQGSHTFPSKQGGLLAVRQHNSERPV
jgi:hypothetical protein